MPDLTGLTKDAGWQAGASRTLPLTLDALWDLIMSPEGLALWLGPLAELPGECGMTYRTADGVTGEVRSVHRRDRLRLTWRPSGRPEDAVLQLTVRPASKGTTLQLHAERLFDADERAAVIALVHGVLNAVAAAAVCDRPATEPS